MGEEHARGAEPGDALAATSSADANPTDRADGETVITQQLIAKCATRAETRRGQDEPLDKYLARLTHLKMDGRNIVHIDALGCAPGVRVLYLYDNAIRRMTNLAPLPHLTHLYLQNNALTRVEGLTSCVNLQKLYLDGNRIPYVDNLNGCVRLEELHVSGQKLPPGEELRFDPDECAALAGTLSVLNVSHCNVRDPKPLKELTSLRTLDLTNCAVESVRDLEPALLNCKRLAELKVLGCPFAKNPKHRDHITLLSDSLTTLNSREIKPHERQFLIQLQARRMRSRRAQAQRSQQQRQHLETIANLGEGTVDHGFDAPADGGSGIYLVDPLSPGAMLGGDLSPAGHRSPAPGGGVSMRRSNSHLGGSVESLDGMTLHGDPVGAYGMARDDGGVSPGVGPSRRLDLGDGVGDDSVRTE